MVFLVEKMICHIHIRVSFSINVVIDFLAAVLSFCLNNLRVCRGLQAGLPDGLSAVKLNVLAGLPDYAVMILAFRGKVIIL